MHWRQDNPATSAPLDSFTYCDRWEATGVLGIGSASVWQLAYRADITNMTDTLYKITTCTLQKGKEKHIRIVFLLFSSCSYLTCSTNGLKTQHIGLCGLMGAVTHSTLSHQMKWCALFPSCTCPEKVRWMSSDTGFTENDVIYQCRPLQKGQPRECAFQLGRVDELIINNWWQ